MLEDRFENSDRILTGKDSQLEEKDLALYKERTKVSQLEHKQKQLVKLLNMVPKDMLKQILEEKGGKGRGSR